MTVAEVEAGKFTPTERRILTMLADGFGHRRREVLALLDDDLASVHAGRMAISRLRKKLPTHLGVICEYRDKQFFYRMVQFVGGRGE